MVSCTILVIANSERDSEKQVAYPDSERQAAGSYGEGQAVGPDNERQVLRPGRERQMVGSDGERQANPYLLAEGKSKTHHPLS